MDNLEAGRRRARRRWAGVCFYAVMVEAAIILGALLLSPARAEISAALSGSSALLVSLFAFKTGIVLAYLGVSLADSWRRNNVS